MKVTTPFCHQPALASDRNLVNFCLPDGNGEKYSIQESDDCGDDVESKMDTNQTVIPWILCCTDTQDSGQQNPSSCPYASTIVSYPIGFGDGDSNNAHDDANYTDDNLGYSQRE